LQLETRDADFARTLFEDLKVDVLLTSNPLFDQVRKHYTTSKHFVEQDIPCATVEGLILLKLYALPSLYRQGNFTRVGLYENDIATLMYAHKPSLTPLLTELTQFLDAGDLTQVRQIVDEIQLRISRFEERK
jgi:hypothetical protein